MCLNYVCVWSALSYTVLFVYTFKKDVCEENVTWLNQSFTASVWEYSKHRGLRIFMKSSRWECSETNSWSSPVAPDIPTELRAREETVVSVRRGSEGSSHVLTCANGAYDDRHGHRSRLCWVLHRWTIREQAFQEVQLSHPSYPEEGTTWNYTKSLTQDPFRCACNEKEATRTMLAHSSVSPKHSLKMTLIQM